MKEQFTPKLLWETMVSAGLAHDPANFNLSPWKGPMDQFAFALNQMVALNLPTIDKADEDGLVAWANNTPELAKLLIYRYLNRLGYRMSNIDTQINAELRKQGNP